MGVEQHFFRNLTFPDAIDLKSEGDNFTASFATLNKSRATALPENTATASLAAPLALPPTTHLERLEGVRANITTKHVSQGIMITHPQLVEAERCA
jgi:hypothetical protein